MGGKRDQNRRLRTKVISAAALKLFLERGIEDVTIDEIVGGAGVAKGSFYRYFRDKTDLVETIFTALAAEVDEAFDVCAAALDKADTPKALNKAYELLAEKLSTSILQQPEIALLYLQECRAPSVGARASVRDLADRVTEKSIELTHVARKHGLLRPIDPRVSAMAVVGASEKLLFAFLTGENIGDVTAVPEALISMILDGLRASK